MKETIETQLNQLKQEIEETEMENTETATPKTSKVPPKKLVIKKGVGAVKSPKAAPEEKVAKETKAPKPQDDSLISLKKLCQELKLKPVLARRKLRAAELHADGRYSWSDGSKELTKVREILSA